MGIIEYYKAAIYRLQTCEAVNCYDIICFIYIVLVLGIIMHVQWFQLSSMFFSICEPYVFDT